MHDGDMRKLIAMAELLLERQAELHAKADLILAQLAEMTARIKAHYGVDLVADDAPLNKERRH